MRYLGTGKSIVFLNFKENLFSGSSINITAVLNDLKPCM